jgi:AcrR family transcriptional regulator
MEKTLKLAPRKRPTQARARARVELILDATAMLLERDGYDALTTNAIAQAAGVNVASLYQYFPNKQAIMAALAQRMATAWLGVFDQFAADFEKTDNWRNCYFGYLDRLFIADAKLTGSGPVRHAMNSDPALRDIDLQNDSDIGRLLAEGFARRGNLPNDQALLIATTITGSIRYLYDLPDVPASRTEHVQVDELMKMHELYLASYFDTKER